MAKKKPRGLDDAEDPPTKATKAKTVKAPKPPKKSRKTKPKAPKATDYLKDLRAMSGVEPEDFAFFSDPLAWTSDVNEWLPTGSIAIDRLLGGGGWPVGRISELAAWESVGKSTLVDQSIAMAQSLGAIVMLVDSERARDRAYTEKLGVDLSSLIVHKAETVEEGFEGIDRLLCVQEAHQAKLAKSKEEVPPMLIAWDSLAGLPTKAERDGSADDKHVAEAAKRVKLNFRRIAQRIEKARVAFVFTNQFYQDIGPFGGLKTAGGSGVRYYTSVRIWLSRTGKLEVSSREVGHTIKARLKKTRVNTPQPPAEVGLIYGAGIHNAFTLYEWGLTHGLDGQHRWVVRRGSWQWFMFPDGTHEAFQGKWLGFADLLQQRPDIYETLYDAYMAEKG